MADLDAKEIATKNVPLIVLYVLAIVPIILWFVMVGGGIKGGGRGSNSFDENVGKLRKAERKIKKLDKAIKNQDPSEPVYTNQHKEAFEKRHADYATQIDGLRTVIIERDQALEKWFEGVKLKKDGNPKPNDYITLYRAEIRKLGEAYKDVVGTPPKIYDTEPDPKRLKLWQKRYWIQKYLFESLKQGSKDTVADGGPIAKLDQAPRFTDSSLGTTPEGEGPPVERIDVALTFECRFSDVPKIMAQILGQEIAFEIESLKIEKTAFDYKDDEINLFVEGRATTFNEPYYTGQLKEHSQFKGEDKIHEYLPEPKVRVTLEMRVLDFRVKKPAPPPPEDAGGEE